MFFRSIKGSDYDQVYRNMTTARIKMYPPQMITVRIKMYPPCREYSTKRAEIGGDGEYKMFRSVKRSEQAQAEAKGTQISRTVIEYPSR